MKGTHLPVVTLTPQSRNTKNIGTISSSSDGVCSFVCPCVVSATPALLEKNSKPKKLRRPLQSHCKYQFSQLAEYTYIYIFKIPISVEPLRFFQESGLEELNFYTWHFINPPIKSLSWPTSDNISTETFRVHFSAGPVFK